MTAALVITLAALPLSAQLTLPVKTSEVKVQFGQIVSLEATPQGGRVVVRERDGKPRRIVEGGAGLERVRRVEIRDFTLTRDGLLAIAFHAQLPLGQSGRYLGLYPASGEPRVMALNDVVCHRLASDDLTGIWCLGHGKEDGLVHRVAGERAGRWVLAAPKGITLDGLPELFSVEPGTLQAWLPAAHALVQWSTITGESKVTPMAVPGGHSLISLLPVPGGAVLALLPLRNPSVPEQLNTPYGLFEHAAATGWRPLPGGQRWARGARLAAWNAIWDRPNRRVDWLD